jgi:ferredoxin
MFLMAATVVRRKELLIPLSRLRRALSPAPSASWDPSRKTLSSADIDLSTATVGVTVHLPEGTVLQIKAPVNNTLMQALEAADLGDVWPGGACGGMCSCSTCRVVINHAPRPFPPRSEDEEDMLDVAASATARQRNDESVMDGFLAESSRLGCQLTLTEQDHGLIIALPDDVTNVLEVPLWLRGSR